MKRSILFACIGLLAATTASAQNPPAQSGPNNNAVNSSGQNNSNAPVAGRNSFTEGQAKSKIEDAGYTNVSELKKDDNGVWRGKASKDGASATVTRRFPRQHQRCKVTEGSFMTATISRLYDNYTDAPKAVQNLEAAGVPHSDISIVSNNSDNWFSTDQKVDRDHDGVDDRAEGAGREPASGPALVAQPVCSLALACSRSPGLGLLLLRDGWPQRRSAQQPVLRLAELLARLRRQAFQKKMRTRMPKVFDAVARLSLRAFRTRIEPVLTRF